MAMTPKSTAEPGVPTFTDRKNSAGWRQASFQVETVGRDPALRRAVDEGGVGLAHGPGRAGAGEAPGGVARRRGRRGRRRRGRLRRRRRARVGEVDLLAAVGAGLHPEAVGVEGSSGRRRSARAWGGELTAASVPRHRIGRGAARPATAAGLQRGELDEEADLQGEGEGDDGEVLHGVSPCPLPYGGRAWPISGGLATFCYPPPHGHGRLQAAPRLQRALGGGTHRRAPRLLLPPEGQPGPRVRLDRLLRQPRPGRDRHRLPARRPLRPPQRGEPGGPHRPQHAHRALLRGGARCGCATSSSAATTAAAASRPPCRGTTSASSTAGCRTSRTAPSGTRTSWPRSPTRRPGRGGSWS